MTPKPDKNIDKNMKSNRFYADANSISINNIPVWIYLSVYFCSFVLFCFWTVWLPTMFTHLNVGKMRKKDEFFLNFVVGHCICCAWIARWKMCAKHSMVASSAVDSGMGWVKKRGNESRLVKIENKHKLPSRLLVRIHQTSTRCTWYIALEANKFGKADGEK